MANKSSVKPHEGVSENLATASGRTVWHRASRASKVSIIRSDLGGTMAIPSDDNLGLLKVMRTLLETEVQLEKELLDAAPMPAGDLEDDDYRELDKIYRRYMPSSQVIEIMRFFFMLNAAGVTTGERLRQLIKSHNRRITHLRKIPELSKRKLTFDRLDSGMFSDGELNDAVSNFNDHDRVAFNVRTICRLLVEVASRTII